MLSNLYSFRILFVVVGLQVLTPAASACLMPDWQKNLFHLRSDDVERHDLFIGYGRTVSESGWIEVDVDSATPASELIAALARQQIKVQIISSTRFPELEGRKIWVRFVGGSCGPHPTEGESGYLVGRIIESDEDGLPTVVVANTQSREDARWGLRKVTPPHTEDK